ncbi:hypothetical protein MLD38_021819 [Melastoma candidum]|uniref:Uncharacterized protein n=1 Tax=Melastoma candidum TaxID=119954 RepID=A0ACB9QQE3_9MYRT|nr:hypothetical protein MLD38_021819 [Melastoma candidum]
MEIRGLLDLEKQYAFYKAYHRDPVNILLHRLFVWPVVFTFLLLLYFTPCVSQFPLLGSLFLPLHLLTSHGLFLNLGFLLVLLFVVIDLCLDKKAGSLAAVLCLACWVGSSFLARRLGFLWAWKVVLVSQLVCWTGEALGHALFEIPVFFAMHSSWTFFLLTKLKAIWPLIQVLQTTFHYEPYEGFNASVRMKMEAQIKEWEKKQQRKTM